MRFIPRFLAFDDGHFCITLMPNIPSCAICLFLIKVLTLKVDISGERCTCKFDNIANHTLCGEKNVHKVLIIYLLKACPGTIWFGQLRN